MTLKTILLPNYLAVCMLSFSDLFSDRLEGLRHAPVILFHTEGFKATEEFLDLA